MDLKGGSRAPVSGTTPTTPQKITYFEPCIVIFLCNKNQQNAQFLHECSNLIRVFYHTAFMDAQMKYHKTACTSLPEDEHLVVRNMSKTL